MATTLQYYFFQSPMILLVPKMYVFFYKKWFPRNISCFVKENIYNCQQIQKNQRKKNKFVTEYFLSYLVKGLFNNGRLGNPKPAKECV